MAKLKFLSQRSRLIAISTVILFLVIIAQQLVVKRFFVSKMPPAIVNDMAASQPQVRAEPGLPLRLIIPKLNVSAPIEQVGQTANGDLATPSQPSIAGWYNAGPRPGALGSAVIDGHFGWVDNKAAVFDNLHQLRAGDKLHVEDDKGTLITFVVRASRTYLPNEVATIVFRSNDGKAHLNLVTCQGAWNIGLRGYENRLVVFTDQE